MSSTGQRTVRQTTGNFAAAVARSPVARATIATTPIGGRGNQNPNPPGGGGGPPGGGPPGGGGGGNPPNPPPAPPAPQPAPVFALSPARVNPNAFIDYSPSAGAKLFSKVTASLEYMFDVEERSVQTFIETLINRAVMAGWDDGTGNIIMFDNRNLLTAHGTLTLEEIQTEAATYVNQATRRAQNSYQMYICIMASLTEDGRAKILTEAEHYTVNGIYSGPLLFKVLMTKATTDTRATVSYIRLSLAELDTYMATVNSDIEKFNMYVRQKMMDLNYRGEESNDLYVNLFKGYMACSDSVFRNYIQRIKDRYDEGEDMTIDNILTKGLTKYQELTQDKSWNRPSEEQQQLTALTASFEALKDKNLQLAKGLTRSSDSKYVNSSKKKGQKGSNERKKTSKKKKKLKDERDYASKKVPPKQHEGKQKVRDGKTYYWCDEHLAWCLHKPEECKLKEEREKSDGNSAQTALSKALEVILEE